MYEFVFKCHKCGETLTIKAETKEKADGIAMMFGWLHDYRHPVGEYFRHYCRKCHD